MPLLRSAAVHRASTANLQSVYPGLGSGRSTLRGVYIGRDLFGGSFAYDPWELYARGLLTNPNMLVIGQVGRGKSALVKSYVYRQLVFGRRALMLDPKGENGALCAAVGVSPISLHPDGEVRLNPLDLGSFGDPESRLQERVRIVAAICGASMGRRLTAEERLGVELAVTQVTPRIVWRAPTLRAVVEALLEPSTRAAGVAHQSKDGLASSSRAAALELRRLVDGDLRGMFDSETSGEVDLGAPLVSFDLSALYATSALPILMACVGSWFLQALNADARAKRIVVLDEAWAVLSNLETARWLAGSYKLARSYGVQYLAVLHRLSDLTAAGDRDSAESRLARGLLSDSETVVVYGQPPAEVANTRELLQLNDTEAALVTQLGRGIALWRVGPRSHLIEHRISPQEREIVDTDRRMRENSRKFQGTQGSG